MSRMACIIPTAAGTRAKAHVQLCPLHGTIRMFPCMHHLSVSSKPNSEDFVRDPDAPNFSHNESAFRGPLQYDSTSPRSPPGKPCNSWLRNSGSASEGPEGPLRRWADEPLGIVLGEDLSPDDKRACRVDQTSLTRPLAPMKNVLMKN